jgi:hypothetical protein
MPLAYIHFINLPVDPGYNPPGVGPGLPGGPPLGIWGPPQMPPGIWPSPGPGGPGSGAHPMPPIFYPPVSVMPPIYYPIDPGYFPPGVGGPRPPTGPVDPGWGVTPGAPPGGIWGGGPSATPPIYIPPQAPPVQEGKAYIVAYIPGEGRVTFTVDLPEPTVPTEPEPK